MPDPFLPFGEFKPDLSDYESISSQAITNVVPYGDGYGQVQDFAAFTQALPAPCRGYFCARQSNGQNVIFAGTATKLYVMDPSLLGWLDASRGAGTYGGVASDGNWSFSQFGSLVFATQRNDVLQVFTLGVSSQFANNPGNPPQADNVSVVGQFLVLSGNSPQA